MFENHLNKYLLPVCIVFLGIVCFGEYWFFPFNQIAQIHCVCEESERECVRVDSSSPEFRILKCFYRLLLFYCYENVENQRLKYCFGFGSRFVDDNWLKNKATKWKIQLKINALYFSSVPLLALSCDEGKQNWLVVYEPMSIIALKKYSSMRINRYSHITKKGGWKFPCFECIPHK